MRDLTVKELRRQLFAIEDQEMTVSELRHFLFEAQDQDMKVNDFVRESQIKREETK